MRRIPRKVLLGGVAAVLAAAIGGIAANNHASASATRAGSVLKAVSSQASPSVNAAFLQGTVVRTFVAQAGIQGPHILVSAGSGTDSSAVIVGTNAAGQSCWTISVGQGEGGGPFRCGSAPGSEPGETAAQQVLNVACQTSGAAGSATADAGSCIGFVGENVASVNAKLAEGAIQPLTLTDGAFAYGSSVAGELPTSFVAYDASGQVVARQDIVLTR